MALDAKYLYVVIMDVEPDKEALFNEIYDKEHIPPAKGAGRVGRRPL